LSKLSTLNGNINLNIKKSVIFFIGLISTIITIDFSAPRGYEWQFLLPLLFSILYLLFAPPIKKYGLGYLVLNGVWLIRYCFSPILIKFSNYQIRFYSNVTENELYIALILMLVELIITIFACSFIYRKIDSPRWHFKLANRPEKNKPIKSISLTAVLSLLILTILVLIFDPSALSGFNFIFNDELVARGKASFGTSALIISWAKIVITVYLLSKFGERAQNRNVLNAMVCVVIMMVSISIFNGTSRNMILIEALAYIYILMLLFQKQRRTIFIVCVSSLIAMLLFVTVVRFFDVRDLSEGLGNYDIDSLALMFNSYFAGQQNVAIGVSSLFLFGDQYNILTFFKDILANTIFLNKFVSGIPGTVDMFNLTLYGHSMWADQIPPTITQSLGLFNLFGIFIPAFIVYFILKMDSLAMKTSTIFGVFLATFISINLAFFSPGNITILSTAVTNRFIPLFVIYILALMKVKRDK
jgi:hypothetical protein